MTRRLKLIVGWIGFVVVGVLTSMVATGLFDWRLPSWLQQPKELAPPVEAVPNWWLIGGLGIAIVGVLVIVVIAILSSEQPREPTWPQYREDSFFGLIWRWQYERDGVVGPPVCFCPACDRQLTVTELQMYPTIYGLNCAVHGELYRHTGDINDFQRNAAFEVQRKLRNGEWKTVVERKRAARASKSTDA